MELAIYKESARICSDNPRSKKLVQPSGNTVRGYTYIASGNITSFTVYIRAAPYFEDQMCFR